MAPKYMLLLVLCISLVLFVRGQCSSRESGLYLAKDNRVVSESTAGFFFVPLTYLVGKSWRCLYYSNDVSCNTPSILRWDGQSEGSRCVQVELDGETRCMEAVTLIPDQHTSVYTCSGPGGIRIIVSFSNDTQDSTCSSSQLIDNQCSVSTSTPTPPTSSETSRFPVSTQPTQPTQATQFSGINPLIYTITAVALLGTASIVAMISCCIRQRRAMLRRREFLFGREYLDFMSERDFTQLTANQLAASLQEAPPTYQQSQEIEEQLKEAQEDTPPPLPPRNAPPTSTDDPSIDQDDGTELQGLI